MSAAELVEECLEVLSLALDRHLDFMKFAKLDELLSF